MRHEAELNPRTSRPGVLHASEAFIPPSHNPAAVGPTVPGSVARHWRLVIAVTLIAALATGLYVVSRPKTYQATASIAMVEPAQNQNQALATPEAANPQQYVEAQILMLQSAAVANQAASIANSAIHKSQFTAASFSGPKNHLKVTSQTAIDPNTAVVTVKYSARTPAAAAAGANAVLGAYQAVRTANVQSTYSSLLQTIDGTIRSIDTQLAGVGGAGANNAQAVSLVNQRTALLQTRSQAVVDEQVAASQTPSIVQAYPPTSPANRKLAKDGGIGAVVGFVVAVLLAYALEVRRRRKEDRLASAWVGASSGYGSSTGTNGSNGSNGSGGSNGWDNAWGDAAHRPAWSPGRAHQTATSEDSTGAPDAQVVG